MKFAFVASASFDLACAPGNAQALGVSRSRDFTPGSPGRTSASTLATEEEDGSPSSGELSWQAIAPMVPGGYGTTCLPRGSASCGLHQDRTADAGPRHCGHGPVAVVCRRTTGERNAARRVPPNVLDRQFEASAPNQRWVADFTYIWTAEGWLYVAAVIDLFSRRVVGWSMSAAMTAQLVADALMMAIWRRGKPHALLHHSDQGSQYTSEQFSEAHGRQRCRMQHESLR